MAQLTIEEALWLDGDFLYAYSILRKCSQPRKRAKRKPVDATFSLNEWAHPHWLTATETHVMATVFRLKETEDDLHLVVSEEQILIENLSNMDGNLSRGSSVGERGPKDVTGNAAVRPTWAKANTRQEQIGIVFGNAPVADST